MELRKFADVILTWEDSWSLKGLLHFQESTMKSSYYLYHSGLYFECTWRLATTDQAWWFWHDVIPHIYPTCWSCSYYRRTMVWRMVRVVRPGARSLHYEKAQLPCPLWSPVSSTTLCWRLLRRQRDATSLSPSFFDVLLWYLVIDKKPILS